AAADTLTTSNIVPFWPLVPVLNVATVVGAHCAGTTPASTTHRSRARQGNRIFIFMYLRKAKRGKTASAERGANLRNRSLWPAKLGNLVKENAGTGVVGAPSRPRIAQRHGQQRLRRSA